jgi:hypothetical protein
MKHPQKARTFVPDPWDEDPLISWSLCLQALDEDDTALAAQYLRQGGIIDRRVLIALADRLDPEGGRSGRRYLLKATGRPRKVDPNLQDAVLRMLDCRDLKAIAHHLRTVRPPDKRIIEWVISRLDPPTSRSPRFIVKQPVGRPRSHQPNWLLGLKVKRKLDEFGKLEAALAHFQSENDDWWRPVSRSEAVRSYQAFLKKCGLRR